MAPRVSILLPTFNRPDVVGYAIESALAQTFRDFELLVMGDGCTDHTAEVVQRHGDPRIVWLDWPKAPGFGYVNRNRALRQARGTLIAYLAHDDLWLADHLERLIHCFDEEHAEFCYSRPLDVSTEGRIRPKITNLVDPWGQREWRELQIGYLGITSVMHTQSCLSRYGFWNERQLRGGDWELWTRILDGGGWRKLAYDPTPTTMRFCAHWRRAPTTWRQRLLQRIWAWEGSLLPDLQVTIPDGVPEQEAVWRAYRQSPDEWVRKIRRAVQIDLDRRSRLAYPISGALEAAAAYRDRVFARPTQFPAYTE